jgi:hypothetical protein
MGAIPEYQRKQLASTYIGPAQRDDSVALMAGAIQEGAVEPPLKRALADERAKKDLYTKSVANDSVIKYGLEAQTQLLELQKTYADDPKKYPEAAQTMMKTLSDKYSESIADEDVKIEFMNATGTLQRAAINPSITWSATQQETKAKIAIDSAANNIGLTASRTTDPEVLAQNMGALHDTIFGMGSGIYDLATQKEMWDKYAPKAVEASIFNSIMADPARALNNLNNGVYDKMPGFTSAIKAEYISKADTRIRQQKKELFDAQRQNFEYASTDALAGRLTFERVNEMENAKDPFYSITTAQGNDLREMLFPRVKAEANAIIKDNRAAEKYTKLAYMYIDNKIDQSEWLREMSAVWRDGAIMPEEAATWLKLKTQVTTIKGQREKELFDANMKAVMDTAVKLYKGVVEPTKYVAGAVRNYMSDVLTNQTAPDIAAKRATTQIWLQKLGITDTNKIPKEGLTFKSSKGRVTTVYPPDKNGICQVKESN